ncbi:MAG: hypothetical protein ABSC56_09330 [Solirubrobacteraceae bacterium]
MDGDERSGRRLRAHACRRLLFALLIAAALGASSASALAVPRSTHLCGYFFKRGQDVIVSKGGPVSCANAKKIIKAFWSNTGATQHGTSDADSYWTLAAWPGWKCTQEMGAGQCQTSTAVASYVVKA